MNSPHRDVSVSEIAAARSLGIHTALDTNGYSGGRLSDIDLSLVELVCSI